MRYAFFTQQNGLDAMPRPVAYDHDLAHVHDQGYGGFACGSAPGLLRLLREAGIHEGRIVDLGCGSGIWARELVDAGFDVVGLDLSPAMIELAGRRVPEATFHVGSFRQFPLPPCRAVTALGEVFNYLFDAEHSTRSLEQTCKSVFDALSPEGMLIFDVAGPERCRERKQVFTEGDDWTCLVEYRHDDSKQRLYRRIVIFRRVGELYRRHEELHPQQLFETEQVVQMLEAIGFRVTVTQSYGEHPLSDGVSGFVARKPEKTIAET